VGKRRIAPGQAFHAPESCIWISPDAEGTPRTCRAKSGWGLPGCSRAAQVRSAACQAKGWFPTRGMPLLIAFNLMFLGSCRRRNTPSRRASAPPREWPTTVTDEILDEMRCFEDFDSGEDFRSGPCVHHPVVGFHVRQNSREEIWLEESRTKLASVKLDQLSEPGVIFGGQVTT